MLFKDIYMEKYKHEEWHVVIKIVDLSKTAIMGNYCTWIGFFARWHGVGEEEMDLSLYNWVSKQIYNSELARKM